MEQEYNSNSVNYNDNETDADKRPTIPAPPRKLRGFAAMDRAKVRELASKGGKRSHELGVAHEFSSEEAKRFGSIGGKAFHRSRGKAKTVATSTATDAAAEE